MTGRPLRPALAAGALALAAAAALAYLPAAGTWIAVGTEVATATILGNSSQATNPAAFPVVFDGAGGWSLPVSAFGVTLTGTTVNPRGRGFRLVADEASSAELASAMETAIRGAAPSVERVVAMPPRIRGRAIRGDAGDVLAVRMTLRARASVRLAGRLLPMGVRVKGIYEATPAY